MSESDSALNSYLRKVGQVPLLTPNEEIELGRRIRNGDAAARERMIHANLRLVVTIARDYVNFGLPLLGLISEGNMGVRIGYIRKFSDKLQIEMLRAYRPDRFKTAGVNVNVGTRGDVFVLSEEQRHELMRINREWLLTAPIEGDDGQPRNGNLPESRSAPPEPQQLTNCG